MRLLWMATLLLSSCALTSKATPLENRYFSPENAKATGATAR